MIQFNSIQCLRNEFDIFSMIAQILWHKTFYFHSTLPLSLLKRFYVQEDNVAGNLAEEWNFLIWGGFLQVLIFIKLLFSSTIQICMYNIQRHVIITNKITGFLLKVVFDKCILKTIKISEAVTRSCSVQNSHENTGLGRQLCQKRRSYTGVFPLILRYF